MAWPCAKNAVVQDYIDAFREHVRQYQLEADVFLVFDRYVDGSTNEETSNKIQITNYIIAELSPVARILLHFKNPGSLGSRPIFMESPLRQQGSIDIDDMLQ